MTIDRLKEVHREQGRLMSTHYQRALEAKAKAKAFLSCL
jgi:hypothetical protein